MSKIMDADLYDEFGNYIGPEIESEEEDDDSDEDFNRGKTRDNDVRIITSTILPTASL